MYYVDNYSILVVTLLLLVYIAETLQIITQDAELFIEMHITCSYFHPPTYISSFSFQTT